MKLAVCLITADRSDYTGRTIETLIEHNDTDRMILLHADDGSKSPSNKRLAEAGGFTTIYESAKRRGVVPALRHLWLQAAQYGATHILHLENDCESLRPLPMQAFSEWVDCVRLYGEYKDAARQYPTGPHHMGTKDPIRWQPHGAFWQLARCHWGAQPSVTKSALLVEAITHAESLKDVSMYLRDILTLRPQFNITSHIGVVKTEGARFHA